jgi:PAT family beta-lactamase induction signal transducer AmpG
MTNKMKWLALISLYMVQGLPHGFFGQAMPVMLREQGVDLRSIGLMSLVALPWALKFIWAPILDRYTLLPGEYRRSWILAMNHTAVLALVVLSFVPLPWLINDGILTIAIVLLLVNLLTATQDIATDAMAVENLSIKERGIGNGIQVGGYRIGMVLAGGALLSFYSYIGWQAALLSVAGLMFIGSLPLYFWKPRKHTAEPSTMWSQWQGFFRLDGALIWLLLIGVYKFGDAFGTQMIRPYLSDLGLGLDQMGTLLGLGGFAAGLFGALLGGLLVSRMGRATALFGFLALEGLAIMAYALVSVEVPLTYWGAVVFEHIAGGMATAGLFTVMMDRCREHNEGADYAFQSCLVIITGMMAGALSGYSASQFGYDLHFVIAGGACFAAIGVVIMVARRGLFVKLTH